MFHVKHKCLFLNDSQCRAVPKDALDAQSESMFAGKNSATHSEIGEAIGLQITIIEKSLRVHQ